MSKRDWAVAEATTALNAAVVSAVFYGVWTLLTAGSFSVATWAKAAGVLFALANAAFLIAKARKGAFWHVGKYFAGEGE